MVESQIVSNAIPRSGYDLAAKILETHPDDAIETMLKYSNGAEKYSNGAECDWLEFKAGMTLRSEDEKKGDKPDDLYWDYVLSIVAMTNTRGGAFVIGVNDKTHKAVSLSSCDPRHVLESEGTDGYLRKEVLDRLDRRERKWSTKDGIVWSLDASIAPYLEGHFVPFDGTIVLVLLVKPAAPGAELLVSQKIKNGDEFESLPFRQRGEAGMVKRLTKRSDIQRYQNSREVHSPLLASIWTELDSEARLAEEDAELDEAIRTYYADLEKKTRQRLRAFVPLDAAGDGETDEAYETEFEDPPAVSVFDEDDEPDQNEPKGLLDSNDDESSESDLVDEENDDSEDEPKFIRMGLSELLGRYDRVILSGEPGAGKTTCLAHFAVERGREQGDRPHLFAFVQLGRWAAGCSVLGFVKNACGLTLSQIDTLLEEKRLHLVLDALNECPDKFRSAALENIRFLVREHPDLPVVLSMRRTEKLRLPGFPVFEVQAMDRDRQRQFLERRLGSADKAAAILDALEQQPGGASIAQNPMLLKMVVDVVRNAETLPSGRATLYRAWLKEWYDKEAEKARKAKTALPWTPAEAMKLLARMAFAGRAQGYRDIPIKLARKSLNDADSSILDRLCQGPLLDIEENLVHFRHETFQEYLCAEWLLSEPTALDAISEKDYDTWGMPIAYAAELSLPGKLPKELSNAVWEMNPWIASLTIDKVDIPRFVRESQVPHYILASTIASGVGLMDSRLDVFFDQEIFGGQLFLQTNPGLAYIVRASDSIASVWTAFECSYILHFPEKTKGGSKIFKELSKNEGRSFKKVIGLKRTRLLTLNRDTFVQSVQKYFPFVSLGRILTRLTDYFVNFSNPHKILCLFDSLSLKSCLPIEVFFRCIENEATQSQLDDLFGIDSIPRAMQYLANNPNATSIPKAISFFDKFGGISPGLTQTACASILESIFLRLEQLFSGSPCVSISRHERAVFCNRLCQLMILHGGNVSASEIIGTISPSVQQFLEEGGFEYLFAPPNRNRPFYTNQDLTNNITERQQIERELSGIHFEMKVRFLSKNRDYLFFSHPSFPDNVYYTARESKFRDAFEVGQTWNVQVKVDRNFKDGSLGFVAQEIKPLEDNPGFVMQTNNQPASVSPKSRSSSVCDLPQSDAADELLRENATRICVFRKSDLVDDIARKQIARLLKNARWDMRVLNISEDRGYLFFTHPSFPDNVYCPARFTKYQDSFEVGQSWNVFVGIKQNKKDGSFGFVAQSVEPAETNPIDIPQSKKQEPGNNPEISSKNTRFSKGFSKGFSPMSIPSDIHVYIDEAWPGFQDHSKKNIGVIAGIVWMGTAPNENILPFVETHLRANGGQQLNALLRCDKAFPFAFPIRFSRTFEPDSGKYLELLSESMVVLLGWILPRPTHRTKVFIHAEHYGAFTDGAEETNSFRALLAGATMTLDAERLSRWSVEKVEWQGKNFGYIPYGDLVAYLFAETPDARRMAREFQVERWPGCVPFSPELLPALRDLDAADPAGAAGALFRLSGLCGESMLFRHLLRSFLDSAKEKPELRNAVLVRLCEEFERKNRDLRKIGRIADAFFAAFPDEAFEDRPRPRFLRLLSSLQQANHDGNPAAADEAFRLYKGLRAEMEKRDPALCVYADLNAAVHFNDCFEFEKAESLLRQCREAPSFSFLSVRDRGRLLSGLGQSAALQGRHAEADGLFREALVVFSELSGEMEEEADQTRIYRAFAALDAGSPDLPARLEEALGISISKAVTQPDALAGQSYHEHLLVKTLWFLVLADADPATEWTAAYLSTCSGRSAAEQHPWELILLYRGLLAWKTDHALANRFFDEWDEWYRTVPHGGTLSLIRGFGLVAIHRHCGRKLDKAALESLLRPVAEALPATAPTVDSLLRIAQDDSPDSLAGLWSLLPFNYK